MEPTTGELFQSEQYAGTERRIYSRVSDFVAALQDSGATRFMVCDPQFPSGFQRMTFVDSAGTVHDSISLPESNPEAVAAIANLQKHRGLQGANGSIEVDPTSGIRRHIFGEQVLGGELGREQAARAFFAQWLAVASDVQSPDATLCYANRDHDGQKVDACLRVGNDEYIIELDGQENRTIAEASRATGLNATDVSWVRVATQSRLPHDSF